MKSKFTVKKYFSDRIFIIFTLSLVIFFFFLGFNFSNPTNSDWLTTGDLISYQDGWNFFKNDDWRFPIGALPNYGIDVGNSIVYADIIPFFAILFKIFKNLLFFNFQYFSIWILISIFLQLFISYLIFFKFTKNFNYSLLGSFFFALAPVFLYRFGIHIALASHWLILLSIYIETIEKNKNLYRNLNIIFSITVHFSLTIIILMFHYFFKLDEFLLKKNKYNFFLDGLILFVFSIFIMYLIGYFEIPAQDGLGGGYGYFSFNLNGFFNPVNRFHNEKISWSLFLPILKYTKGHYEGFSYLGLSGILFLFLFLVSFFIKKNGFIFKKKKMIIISLFFFLLAISNNVYYSDKLIFSYGLNNYLYGILGIIRASGRLIWPVYYLIFFTGIIFIYRNFNSKNSFLILFFLLFVQIVDLSPGFKEIFNGKIYLEGNKLKDSIWNIIPNHYNTVRILERTNTSDLYFKMPDYLGRNGFKKTDIFNAARVNRVKLEEGTYKTTKKISNKITDSNAVYLSNKIQHARYLKYIFQNDSNYHFYFRDGIWILTDKKIIEKNNNDLNKFNELKAKFIHFNKKESMQFNLNDSYQGLGWKKTPDGIISVGYLSSLLFSLDQNKCKKKNYLNLNFKLDDNLHAKDYFGINIFVNKKLANKLNLKEKQKNLFQIEIECSSEEFLIEFEILNPLSLRENKKHLNAQKLGFEITDIELIN